MTTRNWPELIAVMQYIIDHPEKWDQSVYTNTCGTAFCFAGHAAIRAGGRQITYGEIPGNVFGNERYTDLVTIPDSLKVEVDKLLEQSHFQRSHITRGGLTAYDMGYVANVALALSETDCDYLFDAKNTLQNLVWILSQWAREDDVTLPDSWPEPQCPVGRILWDEDYEI